jgi:hypothetical protein
MCPNIAASPANYVYPAGFPAVKAKQRLLGSCDKELATMFGKPQWFRPKAFGWGLTPITWQGWFYTLVWTVAIALPFIVLIWRHQPLEAAAWMGLGIGALCYDVRQILLEIRGSHGALSRSAGQTSDRPQEDVLYIGDSQSGPVATRNYQLQLRQ